MRKFLIITLLGCLSLSSWSQEKYALIQNLNENWFYYDDEWHPVTDRFEVHEAIFFKLNGSNLSNKYLEVKYPGRFSIFIGDKILSVEKDSALIHLDSLRRNYSAYENELISVHTKDLQAFNLKTVLLEKYFADQEPDVEGILNIESRKQKTYFSFYALAFILILIILALSKSFYPKVINDFYNLRKTISAREVEENSLRGRLFSQINLMLMIIQCLIIALFISLLLIQINGSEQQYMQFYDYLGQWLNISLMVAAFVFIKFILIRNFTSLYNIGNFSTPHFMTFLRFSSLIFGVALVVLYVGIYGLEWQSAEPFRSVSNGVLLLLALSSIFIFLKLINTSSYKLLFLFSYLCATEILPYVVVLKIAINHSI